MTDFLFAVCVKFLRWLSAYSHLTYKEVSVVFNLWIQGIVLLVANIIPLAVGIAKGCGIITLVLLMVYASVSTLTILKILYHYMMPMDDAFDLCVKDLLKIAAKCNRSYNFVNIAIFVVFYLLLLSFAGLLVCILLW